ncbi:MAG: EamA family transporter [Candidatus Kapabacteria bacterium]|nr:EamA family transporter [Candidatus Kapabacteria bacterium]
MKRTVLLASLQCLLSVGGMTLLTTALHGKGMSFQSILLALKTWQGSLGCLVLFASFVVMGTLLAETRLSVYVPLTTGLTFLFTAFFSIVVLQEKPDWYQWLGMSCILLGVILTSIRR